MSKTAIANNLIAWETLLANVKTNAAEVPDLAVYTVALEQVLTQAKELTARLESRKGLKQQDSRDRRALMQKGTLAAARLRAALKANYGVNSERLIDYGARPVRPRTHKTKPAPPVTPETPPPTTTPPPAVHPGGSGAAPPAAGPADKPAAQTTP